MLKNIILLALASSLAACGQFAWKRGGSEADLAQASAECKTASNYSACMTAKGWHTSELDSSVPMVLFVGNKDNREAAPNSARQAAEGTATDAPTTPYAVSAWWSRGTPAHPLSQDMKTCSDSLGDPHKADPNTHVITLAMLNCMKDKGWYGMGRGKITE